MAEGAPCLRTPSLAYPPDPPAVLGLLLLHGADLLLADRRHHRDDEALAIRELLRDLLRMALDSSVPSGKFK